MARGMRSLAQKSKGACQTPEKRVSKKASEEKRSPFAILSKGLFSPKSLYWLMQKTAEAPYIQGTGFLDEANTGCKAAKPITGNFEKNGFTLERTNKC